MCKHRISKPYITIFSTFLSRFSELSLAVTLLALSKAGWLSLSEIEDDILSSDSIFAVQIRSGSFAVACSSRSDSELDDEVFLPF